MRQPENAEASICRICLETVTNPICSDCLFDNIRKWVSIETGRPDGLNVLLEGKHADIKKMLSHDHNRAFCVSCKKEVDEIACPCCYLYEMQSLIKSVSPEISQKFEKDFNFDFVFHHGMSQLNLWESIHGKSLSTKAFKPILITEKRKLTDMNTCESCEVVSDDLAEIEGRFLCEECRDDSIFVYE